ncbi:xylulokinase [Bifidobacterium sp. ESL0728]|uniref:xylulokinase n=1 Tax=Bifidobacterium sp. ESL0728 TaxID=2983220 RepID=UPI0023F71C63|nr:xylulokinase [Bifidobacterium sp. ESL0728]WEV59817.1 xylulokinase [Bifidobacterium sp. ESL0728]
MATLVMGVDSSTQSCKVELRDAFDGKLVGHGKSPHPSTKPPKSEQYASDWWDALVKATHQAIDGLQEGYCANDVFAISISAQCHGLVMLDENDTVIRKVKLWNDTTTSPQNDDLIRSIGKEEWIHLVGSLPTAAFTASKVAYMAREEPEIWKRVKTVMLPHDYLTFRLTGRYTTDRSDASNTGYYDSFNSRYLPEVFNMAVDGDGPQLEDINLPEVLGPEESAGVLLDQPAKELGLRSGIKIGPGGGDQEVSSLGLGILPGDLALSLGTSGVTFTVSQKPIYDDTGLVNGVADAAGGWLPLTCVLNCAQVFSIVASWLGVGLEELNVLASNAPTNAERPIFVAYLNGERTPNLPLATASISGLTSDTTRESLALSLVEGIAMGMDSGRRAMIDAGAQLDGTIIATGGAMHSPAFLQALADFMGQDICGTDVEQAVARGAAIQAAAVLREEKVTEVRNQWKPKRTVLASPRSVAVSHSDEVIERYRIASKWRGLDRNE